MSHKGEKMHPRVKMLDKQPDNISIELIKTIPATISVLLTGLIAAFGGGVNYLTTVRQGKKFKWQDFWIECASSMFVGIIFGLFFLATNMPILMALAGAGLAGHMGTRSLMVLREAYKLSAEKMKNEATNDNSKKDSR